MIRTHDGESLVSQRNVPYSREYEHQAIHRGYFFGQFRFVCGKQPVGELMRRRNKARMLLKWFLLNPGKLGSIDEFIDLFWPEVSPETSLGNFHVTMHYLRHMLEPDLEPRQESRFIRRTPNNFYWLQTDESWWTDVSDIQRLLERAHSYNFSGEKRKATFYYRKIASYCSLGFLPENEAESWLLPYRRHYEHIYSQVLMHLIQLYTQINEWEEVLEYAYQFLQVNPYNEIATRAIVNVYLQQGNVTIAQRKLEDFWASLQRDLGLFPSQEFHDLRERIRTARDLSQ
jgi:DNA-binding SARP family transcriptional activator